MSTPVPLSRLRGAGIGRRLRLHLQGLLAGVEAPLLTEEAEPSRGNGSRAAGGKDAAGDKETELYPFGLCLSVWLSTLRRRGKSPERLFTGDLTLNCRRNCC